ncbi:hypothetical protein [Roseofilum capinflatum]|uniref:Uncharacterized protein n=1 Tax=Roseofilum capinflatum BLCC-M114 TaxID=3022440 RepID=A0ABT7BC43_9CYAN|nr:hypothetical protein [Roseofilum capinflatum]MDJ1176645.1 hypothetical protein [Roseofilum capinflatum BLCC-M114]
MPFASPSPTTLTCYQCLFPITSAKRYKRGVNRTHDGEFTADRRSPISR